MKEKKEMEWEEKVHSFIHREYTITTFPSNLEEADNCWIIPDWIDWIDKGNGYWHKENEND